jgi:hypothetical protein
MKIACPKCCDSVIRDGVCPRCGFTLTVGGVWRFYRDRLARLFRRTAVIPCPHCGGEVRITASLCPHCNEAVTASAVVDTVTAPSRRLWRAFVNNPTPGAMRRFQWAYLLASGLVLWGLLTYIQEHAGEHWLRESALSVLYLAILGFIVVLVVPSSVFEAVAERAAWRVKLAMIANYLTLLILLQLAVGAWWAKALTLAGLFVAAYVGVLIMLALRGPPPDEDQQNRFDPSRPQGRRGRFD